MDCAQYRRSILADPKDPSAALSAHRARCHECSEFTEKLLRFEGRLERALRVELPERGREPARRSRWLALAASVLVAAGVAGGLWLAAPGPTLAADVINHMAEEPFAWKQTDVPVPQPALREILNASHVRLRPDAALVSYANSCLFRGHAVPHLVVQTETGPVTVMVLTHEPLAAAQRFDEQGYRGVLLPVPGHGSLAVLERGHLGDARALDAVAERVLAAIDWTS